MPEMKSIYQVPFTKDFVDLHYLLSVSRSKIDWAWNNNGGYTLVKMSLHYRLSPSPIDIAIRLIDLIPQEDEIKLGEGKWQEKGIKKFEDCIRLPLVRRWEEYRKHMVE